MKLLSIAMAMGMLLMSGAAIALDGDTSARNRTVSTAIEQSTGVMIRVAIDAEGRENLDESTIRVHTGDMPASLAEVARIWEEALPVDNHPDLSLHFDEEGDSSTWWHHRRRGWAHAGFYYHTVPAFHFGWSTPVFYSRPYHWTWVRPVVMTPHFGFRYYYYPRVWW